MAGSQGRGSAGAVVLLGVVLLSIILHSDATIYTVGDQGGWTFNAAAWTQAKRFRSGDQIIFKYSPALHNVVAVDVTGYKTCRVTRGSRFFTSGNDRVILRKGTNYFICSVVGHCAAGMKLAITAI
ncbi:unnamed protein product [Spirodela intermedia]|uniref:Plantacyanin n=1 Tax=Spirodela intermedia TaxID=51605 RepID=A0A7I8KUN2_SPIIN|nr:unnamed protein product [Spirodela intermedia]